MKPVYLVTFFSLIVISACKQPYEKSGEELPPTWNALTIISEESTVITINNYEDTSIVNIYHTGTIFTPRPKKIKIDTIKACFTAIEKDSIFSLMRNIISNPPKPMHGCTDFVGDLKLIIDYGGGNFREPGTFEQSVAYSGVCDWNTLSDKTERLHNILSKRIKNIFLGEGGANVSHVSN